MNEHHLPEQKDGTARPSLALENLQHIENMRGSQRDNAEAALRGVLGSMYTGERQLHESDFHWHRLKAFVFSPEICPLLRKAGSDSVRETYTDHATAHTPDVSHILYQSALTIIAFFRILVLYPEVQKRAQKELDAVTGGLRLPDYNDRPRLPYIDALCREVMRWSMATPVGW